MSKRIQPPTGDSVVYPVTFYRDDIRQRIAGCHYDMDFEDKSHQEVLDEVANEVFAQLAGQFSFISQTDFNWQVEHYGEGSYMNDAQPGDLLWCDGEVFCDKFCIEGWWQEVCQEDRPTIEDAGKAVLYYLVIETLSDYQKAQQKKAEGESQE